MKASHLLMGLFLVSMIPATYASDNVAPEEYESLFLDDSEEEVCICEEDLIFEKICAEEEECFFEANFDEKGSRREKMRRDRKFKKHYEKKEEVKEEVNPETENTEEQAIVNEDEEESSQNKKKKCECVRVDKKVKNLHQYNNQDAKGKAFNKRSKQKTKIAKAQKFEIPFFMAPILPLVIGQFGFHSHH